LNYLEKWLSLHGFFDNFGMDTLQAIILGIVQGLTEFLPVSSSGHLQLANELLGTDLNPDSNLTFSLTLHAATVLSTIVVLWTEIWRLIKGVFSRTFTAEQAYVLKIVISMVPVGIVGLFFKDYIEVAFSSIAVVGVMLLVTAALLAFAYYAKPRQKEDISYRDSFIIGLAQAVAVMPGLSRSGSTIATGLLLGNKKQSVAQFSFLMVLPPILGHALLDIVKGDFGGGVEVVPLMAGFVAAFVTGCIACKWMIGIVKRGKLIWFAAYCAVAGVVALVAHIL
jgi:undecaprenyl-diphosphatase